MGTETVYTCDDCGKVGKPYRGIGSPEWYSFGISINPPPMLNTWNHWRGVCLLCVTCAKKHPVFAGSQMTAQNYGDKPSVVLDSLKLTEPYAGNFRKTDYI